MANIWKLNSQLFYPIGLNYYGTERKYAILVWSPNMLYTLICKNIDINIKQNNKPVKKYKHTIIDVIDIIVGKEETIILTKDGSIMYFESSKTIKKIDYLENIKCVCATKKGFAMISASKIDHTILIQLHGNLFPKETDKILKNYKISFEQNYCQSTWYNSQFYIKELRPNLKNPNFFRCLRRANDENYDLHDRFLFFSIDCIFLCLIGNDDDNHVHHIQRCSSKIQTFWSSKDLNAIYLLLASGVIEVIHINKLTGTLKQSYLYFGDDIIAWKSNEDIFVYSDGFKLVQAKINYCATSDTYTFTSISTNIYGIVALTFLKKLNFILCISENRTLWVIPCQSGTFSDDDEFLNKPNDEMIDIIQLTNCYNDIKNEIVKQNKTFEILALKHNRNNYRNILHMLFEANISVHKTIPKLGATAIFPCSNIMYDANTYFVHIQIQPNSYAHIFGTDVWNILVQAQSTTNANLCKYIRLFNEALKTPLDIIICFKKDRFFKIPNFIIEFNTAVCVGHDYISISFPVKVNNVNIEDIIEVYTKIPIIFPIKTTKYNEIINNIKKNHKKSEILTKYLYYKFKLPNQVTLSDVLMCFTKTYKPIITEDRFYVVLLRDLIEVSYNKKEHILLFKSDDPGAMFYIKDFTLREILKHFKESLVVQPPHGHILDKLDEINRKISQLVCNNEPLNVKINEMLDCVDAAREACSDQPFF